MPGSAHLRRGGKRKAAPSLRHGTTQLPTLYKQWSWCLFTTIEILTKIEVGTKDWGIAVIDLTILLFERIMDLGTVE